jgi:hypothetical protein
VVLNIFKAKEKRGIEKTKEQIKRESHGRSKRPFILEVKPINLNNV